MRESECGAKITERLITICLSTINSPSKFQHPALRTYKGEVSHERLRISREILKMVCLNGVSEVY